MVLVGPRLRQVDGPAHDRGARGGDDGDAIGGRRVNDVAPRKRDIAMVFQNYALYPHMTVPDNISFGLKLRGDRQDERATRVAETAQHARPRASPRPQAGEALRRAAPAGGDGTRHRARPEGVPARRAAFESRRQAARADARRDRAHAARAAHDHVYVTHDQVEAMTMGDRVAVMREGRAPAVGRAEGALREPRQPLRRRLHRQPRDEPRPGQRSGEARGSLVVHDREPGRSSFPRGHRRDATRGSACYVGRKVAVGIRPDHLVEPHGSGQCLSRQTVTATRAPRFEPALGLRARRGAAGDERGELREIAADVDAFDRRGLDRAAQAERALFRRDLRPRRDADEGRRAGLARASTRTRCTSSISRAPPRSEPRARERDGPGEAAPGSRRSCAARFFDDPDRTYARLRSERPVYRSESWNGWLLTRYADVKELLEQPAVSRAPTGCGRA